MAHVMSGVDPRSILLNKKAAELSGPGATGFNVVAKFRIAGLGPMSGAYDRLDLSFMRAGLHRLLQSFDSGCSP